MKTCAKCGRSRPLDDFHRDSRKADGRRSRCKECANADQLAFQQRHLTESGQWYKQRYSWERVCEVCGKTWGAKSKTARYCSTSCINTLPRYTVTCVVCGRNWKATQKRAKWCSDPCAAQAQATTAREKLYAEWSRRRAEWLPVVLADQPARAWCWIPTRHPARQSIGYSRLFVQGNCLHCGASFCTQSDAGRASYCSTKCQRRDGKDRYRARKHDAYVEPVYRMLIFQRDGWRCGLCSKPTKRAAIVPHPLAPVLDHIIPLAKGGKHEASNTQCAHFRCNSLKGDRGGGEQLYLIG